MLGNVIYLSLERVEELRARWLDGFADGGLFVPGVHAASAGTNVSVCVLIRIPELTVMLEGAVVWRRLPTRVVPSNSLEPGIGVAFHASMRERLTFLERLAHGQARESRRSPRYPILLRSELGVTTGTGPFPAIIQDVSANGALVEITSGAPVRAGVGVELSLVQRQSGFVSAAPVVGRVAWVSVRGGRRFAGLALEASPSDGRDWWAGVVGRARDSIVAPPARHLAGS